MANALLRDFLGTALRHERVRQGKTMRGVSFRASVSLGYVSEIERGIKDPSSEVVNRLCMALDYPLEKLLVTIANDIKVLDGEKIHSGAKDK